MKKTLKKIVPLLAAVLCGAIVQAFDFTSYCEALNGNHWLVKAGIGSGYSILKMDVKANGKTITSVNGTVLGFALPVRGEYLLSNIPLGITLNIRPLWGKYAGMKNSGIAFMAGANYHVAPGPKQLDLYAGLELGFSYSSLEYEYPLAKKTETIKGAAFAGGPHVGASFFFTKNFGINAEMGYPTLISASAVLKF
ncbi:MAG: hypothetical protein NC041_08805 [Bacteroides sp.]|nr:hypothetical protein [Treponema brennaborense]MCM1470551.1 hypothetical protein [Bacteroides sp.]